MEGTPKRAVAISVHPTGLTPAGSASDYVHLRACTAENNLQQPAPGAAPAAPSLLQRRSGKAARSSKRRNICAADSNADNLAALYQARGDLEEALSWCEDRLASMEEELLRRLPNTSTPHRVSPKERLFSRSSHTSAFWKSPRSRRKRYRHGIDPPPLGYYAKDKDKTTTGARSSSTDDEHTVIAYDAFRRRWVPVPKHQLEQAALERLAAATTAAAPAAAPAADTAISTTTAAPSSAKRLPRKT